MMFEQMNKNDLLHWIDMVSFVVVDITEFLDSHPNDANAMQIFGKYQNLRNDALKAYAVKYGPLTIDTAQCSDSWDWATQPWPWEGGCR